MGAALPFFVVACRFVVLRNDTSSSAANLALPARVFGVFGAGAAAGTDAGAAVSSAVGAEASSVTSSTSCCFTRTLLEPYKAL